MSNFRTTKIDQYGSDEPSNLIALTIPPSIQSWLEGSQLLGSEKFAIAMRPDEIAKSQGRGRGAPSDDVEEGGFVDLSSKMIDRLLPRMLFGIRLHPFNDLDVSGRMMVAPYIDTLYDGAIDYVLFADDSNWIFFGETFVVIVQDGISTTLDYETEEMIEGELSF